MRQVARRLGAAMCAVVLILGGLGYRLVDVQALHGEELTLQAHAQRTQRLTVRPGRGLLLDRQGRPLTGPEAGWGLAAFPVRLEDLDHVATALHAVLGDPVDELAARLGASSDGPASPLWLSRNLTAAQAEQLKAMALPGLEVLPVVSPFGKGSLAHHLVGYLNSAGGQTGLEAQLEPWLGGQSQPALDEVLDGEGHLIAGLADRGELTPGRPQYDAVTTIDLNLQRKVEAILDAASSQRQVEGKGVLQGAAVVVDVATGAVRAMVSRPDYDPVADPGSRPDNGTHFLLNRAISAYTPGSIFKVLVAAEALEAGVISPSDTYDCQGHFDVGDYHPTDDIHQGHGRITFADALAESCNVTFMHVGYDLLGRQRLLHAAERFGLGKLTALGLPGEQAGYLPLLSQDYQVAQMSFGQGLTVTPVQMAQVIQAVANGGRLEPLYLVQALRDTAGHELPSPLPRPVARQVIPPWVDDSLHKLLAGVTQLGGKGTGQAAWVSEAGSAGKTGSAEGTMNGQAALHAWFMGYTPLEHPRYAIVVFVEGGGLGGMVAAPIFRDIATAALQVSTGGQ